MLGLIIVVPSDSLKVLSIAVGDKYMILVNTFDQNESSKAKVEKENLNNMTSSKEEEDEIANAGMSNDNGTGASNLGVPATYQSIPVGFYQTISFP